MIGKIVISLWRISGPSNIVYLYQNRWLGYLKKPTLLIGLGGELLLANMEVRAIQRSNVIGC
jgi:hypothetical protein